MMKTWTPARNYLMPNSSYRMMEVEPSEEDFIKSPLLTQKINFWSLVHVFLNFSKSAQNAGLLSSSRRTKPLGNLSLAAAILLTGNTFSSVNNLASCLNLQFFCERVFYDTQRKYLFPVVNNAWEAESNRQIDTLTSKPVVNLEWDGRCDSPGHCAKYGTYTLMDKDTGNVVAFSVVQVSEVSTSNAMEKEDFTRCIKCLRGRE